MRYKFLLFDLDNTLFDYNKAESEALKNTFFEFGFTFDSAFLNSYRGINKVIWQDFEKGKISQKELKTKRFELLSDSLNLEFNPQKFSTSYLHNLSKGNALIDGSKELLSKLYGKSKLYLITNGLTIVQRPRIKNSTIGKYFDGVIISEEVGSAKPHKEIFDIAFNMMHNPEKKDVLIIGDNLTSDIAGGINYGIDTCWFNPKSYELENEFKPTYEILKLKELTTIVLG